MFIIPLNGLRIYSVDDLSLSLSAHCRLSFLKFASFLFEFSLLYMFIIPLNGLIIYNAVKQESNRTSI